MPAERRGGITFGATSNASALEPVSSITTSNSSSNKRQNMSSGFSFGATPAPAAGAAPAGGFSFGGSTPTPAPAQAPAPASGGGFSFGGAPASGGFGTTPTPAPAPTGGSLFGNTAPAPAPSGSLFGAPTNAPSPGTSLFGTPAPAPAGGSLFGTPAPAPAGGSLFGTPAPAPTGGSLFGAPAPAPAGGSLFGAPSPAPASFASSATNSIGAFPASNLAGNTHYAALPPDQKQAIDRLYQAMMQHKRTLLQVSAMAPKLLERPQQADMAAGTQEVPLQPHIQQLKTKTEQLQVQLKGLYERVDYTKSLYETSISQAFLYAQWPTEAVAARRGVSLSKPKNTMEKDTQAKLKDLLDREMARVDRAERMPSPYMWQILEEMEQRIQALKAQMESLNAAMTGSSRVSPDSANALTIIRMQDQAIWKIASVLAEVHNHVDKLRLDYRLIEKGINAIEAADAEERQREHYLDSKMREQMVKTLPSGNTQPGTPAPGTSGGLFGTPAPAPGGFGFGKSPTPSTGGLFGAAAPTPGSSLFGSTPAPAPGGLFGSTPAPSSGGLFGSAPAPAPGAFGAASTPAPAGGSLFGNTAPTPAPAFGASPSPAPAGGFSFGGTTPAPAPTAFGFGAATTPAPSNSVTPRSKNKKGGSRRR